MWVKTVEAMVVQAKRQWGVLGGSQDSQAQSQSDGTYSTRDLDEYWVDVNDGMDIEDMVGQEMKHIGGQRVDDSDIRERQSLHDNVVADKVAEENIGGGEEVSIVRVDQAQAGIVLESEVQGIGKHGSNASPIKAKPPWLDRGNDSGDSGYCQLAKF